MTNPNALAALPRPCFTTGDVARSLKISVPSAWVYCSRKVKSGILLRARKDLYVLADLFAGFGEREFFAISNLIQTPSYVSYASALSFHGLTTQIFPSVLEAQNAVRSRIYRMGEMEFRYYFCRREFYFGFLRQDRFFIAEPEKALLDSLYLSFLGRYRLDTAALDLTSVRWPLLETWLRRYPSRIRSSFQSWRRSL